MVALLSPIGRELKSTDIRTLAQETPLFFRVNKRPTRSPASTDPSPYANFSARWWPGDGRTIPSERQADA
jgi:hypothetical protein